MEPSVTHAVICFSMMGEEKFKNIVAAQFPVHVPLNAFRRRLTLHTSTIQTGVKLAIRLIDQRYDICYSENSAHWDINVTIETIFGEKFRSRDLEGMNDAIQIIESNDRQTMKIYVDFSSELIVDPDKINSQRGRQEEILILFQELGAKEEPPTTEMPARAFLKTTTAVLRSEQKSRQSDSGETARQLKRQKRKEKKQRAIEKTRKLLANTAISSTNSIMSTPQNHVPPMQLQMAHPPPAAYYPPAAPTQPLMRPPMVPLPTYGSTQPPPPGTDTNGHGTPMQQ